MKKSFSALLKSVLRGVVLCTLLAGAAAADTDTPLRYSGTVDIDQTRVSFLVSGNGGGGVLHYRGRDYPFSIGGLGIGGIGVTKLLATGTVYNLGGVERFGGLYSEVRTGYAVGDQGKGKLWLKNDDGVVIKLAGKGKGIGLSLGADAVNISLK